MHSDVSEFDFRQSHFDKYILSLSMSFRKWLDDELALGVEPIVEIVAVNRAALDKVLIRAADYSLPTFSRRGAIESGPFKRTGMVVKISMFILHMSNSFQP